MPIIYRSVRYAISTAAALVKKLIMPITMAVERSGDTGDVSVIIASRRTRLEVWKSKRIQMVIWQSARYRANNLNIGEYF